MKGFMNPAPWDLTPEKILKRMSKIHLNDMITFNSMKECFLPEQVDRHSGTIKITAPVEEHHGGYVLVRLRNGLLESVNYFDIQAVNGHSFLGYVATREPNDPTNYDAKTLKKIRKHLWS